MFTKIRKKLHFNSLSDTFFYILNKSSLNAVKSVLSLQIIVTPLLSCNLPIDKSPPLRCLLADPSEKSINKSNICTNNDFIYINISFILTNISFIYTFLRSAGKFPPMRREVSGGVFGSSEPLSPSLPIINLILQPSFIVYFCRNHANRSTLTPNL